jgi:hypothetical protein
VCGRRPSKIATEVVHLAGELSIASVANQACNVGGAATPASPKRKHGRVRLSVGCDRQLGLPRASKRSHVRSLWTRCWITPQAGTSAACLLRIDRNANPHISRSVSAAVVARLCLSEWRSLRRSRRGSGEPICTGAAAETVSISGGCKAGATDPDDDDRSWHSVTPGAIREAVNHRRRARHWSTTRFPT